MKRLFALLALLGAVGLSAPVWAQETGAAELVAAEETVMVEEAVVAEVATELAAAEEPAAEASEDVLDRGDTAWMLTSTMLVILMTIPGLALFYGGLARSKNMLSVLLHVFVIFCLMTILWCVYGYSLAFSGEGAIVGNFDKLFLKGITIESLNGSMPEYVWVAFQSTFAAITTALIVGSFAERIKFSAVVIFAIIWYTFSYVPMAHIVWGGGFLGADGALDFAGGTVVHINAGIAGLESGVDAGLDTRLAAQFSGLEKNGVAVPARQSGGSDDLHVRAGLRSGRVVALAGRAALRCLSLGGHYLRLHHERRQL
ncbi:hypothetical protein AGMMS50289_21520 [Betaproteobacteria bacterium]|nr:hypothetical protein AGMMS50289_21520 [Betaproteobacteria bacterium]